MNKTESKSLPIASDSHEQMDDYIAFVKQLNEQQMLRTGRQPTTYTHTYGCQQNVADTEKLDGLLLQMGYQFASSPEEADFVLYNTCAVREGAEDRVFGNVGALKQAKANNPDMIIGLCGCMTQQEHIAKRLRQSFPFVDLLFGAGAMHRLPELLYKKRTEGGRVFSLNDPTFSIYEGLPTQREGTIRAWLPIMTGCNNFCTYCVVPFVRGRERSRDPKEVLAEARQLIAEGYKELTLLGQNVNSYGKDLEQPLAFSQLLEEICAIPGEFQVRFMTSHPKDCTHELIDTIAQQPKMARHLHLPVQSGSDRVLTAMNRRYTAEHYLSLITYAKSICPEIAFTSDIIVGFPGETYEDFQKTVALVKEVQYLSLFTFLYSPREGTVATTLEDPVPLTEKKQWFQELLDVQNPISQAKHQKMVGETFRVLLDGTSRAREGYLTGRSQSDVIVDCPGSKELIGQFVTVKITSAQHWAVVGEILDNK